MENKGCDKQLLIFLRTLGAKSISRRVYIINTEKWWTSPAAPKLGFPDILLVKKVHVLCTKTRFSRHSSGQEGACIMHQN